MKLFYAVVLLALIAPRWLSAAEPWGLERGTPDLKSAGALAIGPDNVLFIGDSKSATVFAIATSQAPAATQGSELMIDDFGAAVNDLYGNECTINDLAVNSRTGTTYISVSVDGAAGLCCVDAVGSLSVVNLADVPFAKAELPDAPEDKLVQRGRRKRNPRDDSITDIVFYEQRILVSGLRSGDAPSSVREFAFPFSSIDQGTGIAIYHGAHGKEEDHSAARTFVTLTVDGEPNLLAAYVCTPLVRIPLKELGQSNRVEGTTVAELGNRNQPLDMISYNRGGEGFLLLSNTNRGVMKIPAKGLGAQPGLNSRVPRGEKAGQSYETIDVLEGIVQMDRLNEEQAVVLQESDNRLVLRTIELP